MDKSDACYKYWERDKCIIAHCATLCVIIGHSAVAESPDAVEEANERVSEQIRKLASR